MKTTLIVAGALALLTSACGRMADLEAPVPTGGAIRGVVRADFFWGVGAEAGAQAGRMKQQGQMWGLLPPGVAPN